MVITRPTRLISLMLLCIFQSFSLTLYAANITVTTDRNPVGLNESFTIIFESDGSVDSDPDFSPLNKDFQVLSRNSSSNMTITNGKISSTKKWLLTVLARRAGEVKIPAINFGKDISKASVIKVTRTGSPLGKSSSDKNIFIEVDASTKTPYVQQEVIYTVRLFLAVSTSNASLSEPGVGGASAVIERLGEDKNYQTSRGGKRFNVVERKYAIYPQISGNVTIEAVMFQGQINRNAFSLFDPFGPQPKTLIERSESVTLDVKGIPDSFPAVTGYLHEKLSLSRIGPGSRLNSG